MPEEIPEHVEKELSELEIILENNNKRIDELREQTSKLKGLPFNEYVEKFSKISDEIMNVVLEQKSLITRLNELSIKVRVMKLQI